MSKPIGLWRRLDSSRVILIGLFLGLLILMYLLNPSEFGTLANFKNIAIQVAENGCFATAYFLVFVCGGFNFACITIGNLSAIVLSILCNSQRLCGAMPEGLLLGLGIVCALVTGMVSGGFMSYFISRFKLPPIMVTICAGRLFEGIGFVLTKGASAMSPKGLIQLGSIYLLDAVPLLILVTVGCFVLCGVFLNRTRVGRQARLYGINKQANRYSGISNSRTLLVVYMISGLLSAVGGLIVAAKYGSSKPDYGTTLTSTIILIVMLSGMTLSGGDAKVWNVFIACLCLQVLSTGLNIGGSNSFVTEFLTGVLLLVVVVCTQKSYRWLKVYAHFRRRKGYTAE